MSPNLERGLIYLAITALFAGWAIAQIRSGVAYLNFTGRFTRQASPTVFWGVCAVKVFFAAVCALTAFRLLAHR